MDEEELGSRRHLQALERQGLAYSSSHVEREQLPECVSFSRIQAYHQNGTDFTSQRELSETAEFKQHPRLASSQRPRLEEKRHATPRGKCDCGLSIYQCSSCRSLSNRPRRGG